MNPNDARRSLDDIHRLQDRARDESIRHGFSPAYQAASAAVAFVMLAAADMPPRVGTVVALLAAVLLLAIALTHKNRAAVRRRPTGLEVLFQLGVAAVLVACYAGILAAAGALDLPAPHAIGGAVVVVLGLAVLSPTRRVCGALAERKRP